jgi:hypothetical protein
MAATSQQLHNPHMDVDAGGPPRRGGEAGGGGGQACGNACLGFCQQSRAWMCHQMIIVHMQASSFYPPLLL